jgi:hypothetical protein
MPTKVNLLCQLQFGPTAEEPGPGPPLSRPRSESRSRRCWRGSQQNRSRAWRRLLRHHGGTASIAFSDIYGRDDPGTMRDSATVRPVEDYTNKYKGEQVEVALFGGEYQEGVLTAYCSFEDVPHVELNGHILIPLQNVASLHCSSRCDAPEPDWPPRGFIEDDTGDS